MNLKSMEKLKNLKQAIEEVTDSVFDDLTQAVQALKDMGGSSELEDSLIQGGVIGEYCNDSVTAVRVAAFKQNYELKGPLTFTKAQVVDANAFYDCVSLTKLVLPAAVLMGHRVCYLCTGLEYVDIGKAEYMDGEAFANSGLKTLILRGTKTVCMLGDAKVFSGTPIANGTGYVYVPKALLDSYKADSMWKPYAAQLRAIEDYPDICGAAA